MKVHIQCLIRDLPKKIESVCDRVLTERHYTHATIQTPFYSNHCNPLLQSENPRRTDLDQICTLPMHFLAFSTEELFPIWKTLSDLKILFFVLISPRVIHFISILYESIQNLLWTHHDQIYVCVFRKLLIIHFLCNEIVNECSVEGTCSAKPSR